MLKVGIFGSAGPDYLMKIAAPNIDEYQRFVERILEADIGLKR